MATKEDIRNYYDHTELEYKFIVYNKNTLAKHYGIWDKKVKSYEQSLLRTNEILSEIAKIKPTDKVLDAGCGVGGSSIWLAKNIGCDIIGISLSNNEIRLARDNAKLNNVDKKIEFLQKDYTKTKFPSKSFDVVWAIESVSSCNNQRKFMKEAFRILKPHGKLIVSDGFLLKENLRPKDKILLNNFSKGWVVNNLAHYRDFYSDLKKIGFKNVRHYDMTKQITYFSKRLFFR